MTYRIRKIELDDPDLDAVLDLDRQLLPSAPWPPHPRTEWWAAFDVDGRIVGYGGGLPPGSDASIYYLSRAGVLPEARGHGLQRRLIHVRVAAARKHACASVVTYTSTDNAPSMNSLIAAGFRAYTPASYWVGPEFVYWRKPLAVTSPTA